jgi:lysophospholipase L1-like esterase
MKSTICGILLVLGLGLSAARAEPNSGLVAGDSLGEGVTYASHLPSFAERSVSIRSGAAVAQIERATPGTTVFLSLGTNDSVAVGNASINVRALDGGIQRIVDAAAKAQVHLVWLGPPCVFKPWNKNAVALDAHLKDVLGTAGVLYVSMQDEPRLCERSVRAPDGVHFSMTGYHLMWDKAREAAGFTAVAADETASPRPGKHKKVAIRKKAPFHKKVAAHWSKKHWTKKKKLNKAAEAPAAPAPPAAEPESAPQ